MLYAMIEYELGINVHAAFDDIEIRRAEAQRIEKEQKDAEEAAEALKDKGKGVVVDNEEILGSSNQQEQQQPDVEANEENALVPALLFTFVGERKTLSYSREDNARRIEVERRRPKAKEVKKAQAAGEEEDDEDEEDDDFKDIDDYHRSSDDDEGDDDDQGGNGGALIVRPPGADNNDNYFNDEQNEEKEDAQTKGESTSGSKQANLQKVFSNTPKVIYLSHDVEEG
ncbi:nucleoplasmin-like protein ANO39 [Helianthus annuus]|uniref:nucleoplasmin-like protein ANO39 n=1 Tax=Helianthus annuus TaxID=4232 RepID=UPI000B901FD6|nr:nucleoplasmin-like protein ANO39 [Helianthus annuus]